MGVMGVMGVMKVMLIETFPMHIGIMSLRNESFS